MPKFYSIKASNCPPLMDWVTEFENYFVRIDILTLQTGGKLNPLRKSFVSFFFFYRIESFVSFNDMISNK